MIAHESEFESVAPFVAFRRRRRSHNHATVFYTWQVFELLELTYEFIFVCLCYLGLEGKQD